MVANVVRASWLLLLLGEVFPSASAFQAPLTNVRVSLSTYRLSVTVHYDVDDPATGGVVAWQAEGSELASAFQREMAFATYDPVRGAWVTETRRYTSTKGSSIRIHPHIHALVSERVFLPDGTFVPLPKLATEPFLKLWKQQVFALLLAEGKITDQDLGRCGPCRRLGRLGQSLAAPRPPALGHRPAPGRCQRLPSAPPALDRRADLRLVCQATPLGPRL